MGVKDSRSYVAAYTVAVLCWLWCGVCLSGTVLVFALHSATSGRPLGDRLFDAGTFLLVSAAPVAGVGWFAVRYCWRATHTRRRAGFEVSPTSSPVIPHDAAGPNEQTSQTGREVV